MKSATTANKASQKAGAAGAASTENATMKTLRTITAGELIAALQDLPEDAQVVFSSNYGDHCRTEQVHQIEGTIEKRSLYESAYSDSGLAVVKDEDDAEVGAPEAYVIS